MIQNIETRLNEKGYSVIQAVSEFDVFDKTLREFFGKDADDLLLKIFNNVFELKMNNRGYPRSILIKDDILINTILSTFGNQMKRNIMSAVSEDSAIPFPNILKKISLSQSTAYRVMASLIDDGFIMDMGKDTKNTEGRRLSMYVLTIPMLDIRIKKSVIEMEIQFIGDLKDSRILSTLMFLLRLSGKKKIQQY